MEFIFTQKLCNLHLLKSCGPYCGLIFLPLKKKVQITFLNKTNETLVFTINHDLYDYINITLRFHKSFHYEVKRLN